MNPRLAKVLELKRRGMTLFTPQYKRPQPSYLTTIKSIVSRLPLSRGSFNPGIVRMRGAEGYVMIYRFDELHVRVVRLTEDLEIRLETDRPLKVPGCTDPRLLWTPDNRLLAMYSSHSSQGLEIIRGFYLMDLTRSDTWLEQPSFPVSPEGIKTRQKNWTPFISGGKIYAVASTCPHQVYEFVDGEAASVSTQYEYSTPWIYPEFLRGNTNAVVLEDGNFMGTFHTAVWVGRTYHYDNGVYVFEGKPPFKVVRCSNRTYLPAEAAVEPPVRKAGQIKVCFPVGMVRDGERILISYGDNDSAVKVMETTVQELLDTTVRI